MEQEQDATRGSTGSNRDSCRRLKTCTSGVQGFKTIEAFRAEEIMEVMWNMSEATVVEAIVVEAMADSREAGEEAIDEATAIEEMIAAATVGVAESAAVHANEITGHPAEALLRIGQAGADQQSATPHSSRSKG
jgi:hypothetical protein